MITLHSLVIVITVTLAMMHPTSAYELGTSTIIFHGMVAKMNEVEHFRYHSHLARIGPCWEHDIHGNVAVD